MWEGIVQGVAWDGVKTLVKSALDKLKQEGVAPKSEEKEVTKKESRELGFAWTSYLNGKKQYHMFIGLKKVYVRETKKAQPKSRVSRKRR